MHRLSAPLVVALAAAAAAGLAGCATDERVAAGGSAAATTTAPRFTPATSAPRATSGTTSTSSRAPTTTAARATTTKPKVVPPRPARAGQGDRVVSVFVATGPSLGAPPFAPAKARLATLGYRGFTGGDTSCSRGAKEALPQLQAYSLSLPFATQADAARFVSLYGPVLGTATVNLFCGD